MRNTKNTDSCTFYNKYLLDDLLPYKVVNNNSDSLIQYSNQSLNRIDCDRSIASLKNLIKNAESLAGGEFQNNQWYPLLIKPSTNSTLTKTLLRGSTSVNDTLGIEEAITFSAIFKNWQVNGSSDMSVDWIVNSYLSPYDTQYGLLCWYQESITPYTSAREGLPYEKIPLGIVVKPTEDMSYSIPGNNQNEVITISINKDNRLLNIDNIRFQILDIKQHRFKDRLQENDKNIYEYNNNINIFNMDKYIEKNYPKNNNEPDDRYATRIASIKSQLLFVIDGIYNNENTSDILLPESNKKTMLYISNGDVYSFYNDKTEAADLIKEGFPSSNYLSSSLFPIYREIWHALTIDHKKLDTPFLNKRQHKLLQKLCQYLSTFPLIDRTTVNILTNKEIQDAVKEFINKSFENIDTEISELFKILTFISKRFIDLSADIKNTTNSQSNYIRTKSQLFIKLLAKYGAYLNIKQDTTLSYKQQLPYGPHLKLSQDISSKVQKETRDKVLFNNFTANIGSFSVQTNITENRTYFVLENLDVPGKSINIPLWDIQKKELAKARLNITAGPDLIIPFAPPLLNTDPPRRASEMVYSLEDADLGDIESEILKGEKLDILWSRIYGPDCLRFGDSNLSTIRSEGGIGGPNVPILATPDFASSNITRPGVPGAGTATPPVASLADSRYEESTDAKPYLYIKKTGKYILRLKVKASFGIVYDTVTIYVTNGNGEYEPGKKPPPLKPASFVALQPSNGLTIFCPNFRQFAIGKQGVFWPISSDLSTYDTESNPYGTVASFGSQIRRYAINMPIDQSGNKVITHTPVPLVLQYKPNNTTINLRKIILSHMRDNNENCYNCETFFNNVLDNKGFVVDVNRDFTLTDIASKDPVTGRANQFMFSYPTEVSTEHSRIKTYGGYSSDQISNLGVSIPFSDPPGSELSSIVGANMNDGLLPDGSTQYLCHMKPVNGEKPIIFHKGCFHPFSGWLFGSATINDSYYGNYTNKNGLADQFKNKTAVINLDPGNRNTFKFKGPGFFNLDNSSIDANPDKQVYFSTIELNIDRVAQDCKHPGEDFSDMVQCTDGDYEMNEAQEKPDIDPNHGYRSIGADFTKLQTISSDETSPYIDVDPDGATTSNNYCASAASQRYKATYTFTTRGAYLPLSDRKPKARFNRSITGAVIEDIEVQVNFVNYANTKNLIMWLDVVPCADVIRKIYPRFGATSNATLDMSNFYRGGDRWYYAKKAAPDSIFPNRYGAAKEAIETMEDGPLKKYLQALFYMNNNPKSENTATGESAPTVVTNTLQSNSGRSGGQSTASMEGGTREVVADGDSVPWSPVYRLYLLNQEHVEGNRYNFSLRFSDHAGRYASGHDKNYTKYTDPEQIKVIEKDGIIHLLPTISAFGYSDKDVAFFQNIIRTNKLNTLNNTFAKFSGMDLFKGDDGKLGFGSSTFTLGVAVVNQSDSMEVLDNINNIDYVNGIEQTIKTNRSNFLINNICSWELILHTSEKSFEPVDALGNIRYSEPAISGYNFIANFENKKYLLPPVNLNAPYEYLQNPGICKYNKEKLNAPVFSYTPLNILPIIQVGGAISIYEALGQVSSVNDQMAELGRQTYEYFRNERYARQSEEYFKSLYVPKYDKYPMGEADKALLSISKDGNLWYNLEASIFRYPNSPVLKTKKFKYLKLNYKTSKTLGMFKLDPLKRIESLFANSNDTKTIAVPLGSGDLQHITDINSVTIENLLKEIDRLESLKLSAERSLKDNNNNNNNNQQQINNIQNQINKLNLLISLCDTTLNSIGNQLEKYDIIEIVKTITKPADPNTNTEEEGYNLTTYGIHILDDIVDNKFSLYSLNQINSLSFYRILKKLRQDNLLDFRFEVEDETDPGAASMMPKKIKNHLTILDGLRPYYFFNKGDDVVTFRPISEVIEELRQQNNLKEIENIEKEIKDLIEKIALAKKNNEPSSKIKKLEEELWDKQNRKYINKVKAKGYIHNGENYKTLIELETPLIGSYISKTPENSDVAIIYDNAFRTMDSNNAMPFNKWSFVDTNNNKLLSNNNPDITNSMFGESSYGTGSVLVSPKTLSNKQIKNRIFSLLDLVSVKKSRRGTRMSVKIIPNSVVEPINSNTSSSSDSPSLSQPQISSDIVIGYNYTYNDCEYIENMLNTIGIESERPRTEIEKRLKIQSLFKDYKTYTKNEDDIGLMDIHLDSFKQTSIPDDGYIELGAALELEQPSYKFTKDEAKILENRINILNSPETLTSRLKSRCDNSRQSDSCITNFWNEINIDELYISDLYTYLANIGFIHENNRENQKEKALLKLQKLTKELWTIQYYCDIGGITITTVTGVGGDNGSGRIKCNAYDGPKVLPTNKIQILISNTDQSISFIESLSSDDYWINIDPEQSIVFDYSNTVKIFISAEYECKLVNGIYSSNVGNICPRFPSANVPLNSEVVFENSGNVTKYTVPLSSIARQAELYKDLEWYIPDRIDRFDSNDIYIVQRNFFLNGLSKERNQLVTVTEKYLLPKLKYALQTTPVSSKEDNIFPADGDVKNKVRNVFNLDNIDKLHIRFKHIPRKWKGIDTHYDVYKPNYLGELPAKSIIPSPGGPIDHTLKFWQCINTKTGQYVEPPLYFKWLNEMIFRAYYGSVDGAEHRGKITCESKEITEWIPYDYQ